MYKTSTDAVAYIKALIPLVKEAQTLVYLAVPFTTIAAAAKEAKSSTITIGAQNMHDASEGAFTGEIAAKMLVEAGAKFVLLGHSERRRLFQETNAFINRKIKTAIAEKIQPTLCIGETKEERDAGKTEEVIVQQLTECLEGFKAEELEKLIIAYEPVWAIGTDHTATPEMAQEAHVICRQCLENMFGADFAKNVVIQYGGSVKPENAESLLAEPDIDGLLVGNASLDPESFSKIINCYRKDL